MERALIMFNPDGSHADDKTKRLQRLLRRREARNDILKHNRAVSASRTTAVICGNTNVLIDKNDYMIDDDVSEDCRIILIANTGDDNDEDYGSFLTTYNPGIENDSDKVDSDFATFLATYDPGVEIDSDKADSDYATFLVTYDPGVENDSDKMDSDYSTFLARYDPGVEIDSASNHSGAANIDVGNSNDNDEVDEGYQSLLPTYDPPGYISDDVGVDEDDHRLVNLGSESLGQNSSDKQNSLFSDPAFEKSNELFLDPTYDPPGYISDDVGVDEGDHRSVNLGSESLGQSSRFKQNSLVSDPAFEKNNELILNSATSVDGDKEYMSCKNTTNTPTVEDGGNCSDPDVTILEPYEVCEDTPFVPSKRYDSSYFEELNPKDEVQIAAYDDSQFRRRLLEHLERPYDQQEYESLLLELCEKKKQERHFETRRRVVESYHTEGVTTPYHVMYPDLTKAIAEESKNKRRILFLLRGFFFYMKNVCHMGSFQPWLDESCLELMRKL